MEQEAASTEIAQGKEEAVSPSILQQILGETNRMEENYNSLKQKMDEHFRKMNQEMDQMGLKN